MPLPASGHGRTNCGLAPGNLPRHARRCVCRPRSSTARHNEHGYTQVSLRFLRHVSEQPRIRHIKTPSQPVCACKCLFAQLTLHSGFRQAFQPEPNLRGDQPAQRHAKKMGSDTMKTIAAGLMNVVLSHRRQCFQRGLKNWQPLTIAAREKSSSLKMDCF